MSDPSVVAAYAQLWSLGVVWVSLHCAGMCGPLVAGLGIARGEHGARLVARLGAYQLGKSSIYVVLGAVAGLLGRRVQHLFSAHGALIPAVLGVALIVANVVQRGGARNPLASTWFAQRLGAVLRPLERLRARPVLRAFALGMVMAALPCMLVLWVLALAASTHNPLHGALLMLNLVAFNSVPLLAAARLGEWVRARLPRLATVQPYLTAISGVWLLVLASAAAGWIPHASLPFRVGGRGFVMMFW